MTEIIVKELSDESFKIDDALDVNVVLGEDKMISVHVITAEDPEVREMHPKDFRAFVKELFAADVAKEAIKSTRRIERKLLKGLKQTQVKEPVKLRKTWFGGLKLPKWARIQAPKPVSEEQADLNFLDGLLKEAKVYMGTGQAPVKKGPISADWGIVSDIKIKAKYVHVAKKQTGKKALEAALSAYKLSNWKRTKKWRADQRVLAEEKRRQRALKQKNRGVRAAMVHAVGVGKYVPLHKLLEVSMRD